MYLILLLCITVVQACSRYEYKNMVFKACPLKEFTHHSFHDITGENRVRLVNDRLYHNHGLYTALYKHNILYIGLAQYSNSEWRDALNQINNNI